MSQYPFGFSSQFIPYVDPHKEIYEAPRQTATHHSPHYSTSRQVHRLVRGCAAIHESDQENVQGLLAFLTKAIEQLPARK
jgi:hypothetical protein